MPRQEQADVWQAILDESVRRTANSPPSTASRPGLRRLRLELKPAPKYLTRLPREMALIKPDVRDTLHALSEGLAPWPLFLSGAAGTGKTCASLLLLDHAGGFYFTASSLCETVTQSIQGRLEWNHEGRGGTLWPEQFWARVHSQPLVVVDELGSRDRVSDHHYECVKRALDERSSLPAVFVSNQPLRELLALYDARVVSRLGSGTVVQYEGRDRRLEA